MNFVPQTKVECLTDMVRVAREYHRVRSQIYKEVAKKLMRKAKVVKKSEDWAAVMWTPLGDF